MSKKLSWMKQSFFSTDVPRAEQLNYSKLPGLNAKV